MNKTAANVLAIIVGAALIIGAVSMWKFYEVHPFISIIVGGCGLACIGKGVDLSVQ